MVDITKIGTETAKESLARTTENPSAQILRAIEVVEEHLRKKRSRIEEIQMRHDHLVNEIRQLNKTLESENIDFVSKLNAVINNLDTDSTIVELLPDMPGATETSDLGSESARRDQQVQGSPDDKQAKPGSLRWLRKKERARRETSNPLIPGPEDSD